MNQKLSQFVRCLKKIFSNPLVEKVIRIGLLLVMIIAGLTAFAPEWLELKDVKIAELEKSYHQTQSKHASPLIKLTPEELPDIINRFISLKDKPNYIGAPGAILIVLLWYGYLLLMYLGFVLLWLLVYWIMSSLLKRRIFINHLSQNYRKSFVWIKTVFSLVLTILFWSVLNML